MTAWRACLGKAHRSQAVKMFKVRLMRPDGSMITGCCSEPRELIQLPADLRTMNEHERRLRLAERKPKARHVAEDQEISFDFQKYLTPSRKRQN